MILLLPEIENKLWYFPQSVPGKSQQIVYYENLCTINLRFPQRLKVLGLLRILVMPKEDTAY